MARMKLPACTKCKGTLTALREGAGEVNSLVVIKCINCGWRMAPDDIERLFAEAKGILRVEAGVAPALLPAPVLKGAPLAASKAAPIRAQQRTVKACLDCGSEKRIIGRGLCGSCYHYYRDLGTLDESWPIIGHAHKPKAVKRRRSTSAPLAPAEGMMPLVDVGTMSIPVVFAEFDLELFQDVIAAAKINRRSPGDEILFRLDQLQGAE